MGQPHQAAILSGPVQGGLRPQVRIREPEVTQAVVLVMHGGQVNSHSPARWSQLSVRRMQPFADAILHRGHTDGVAVWSLLFARRGWNGHGSPVADALWALNEIEARYGQVPIVLLGHSMGGRTAIRVAGHPSVIGVVGLAPWLPKDEPGDQLAGRAVSIIHGTRDRRIPIELSRTFASTSAGVPTHLEFEALHGTGHAMLRRARTWHRLAADGVDQIFTAHSHAPNSGRN